MKLTKATSAMSSPPPAGDGGPPLNTSGMTWEQVMSTGMRARMAMMQMQMRIWRKMHRKPMMDERRLCRTVGIVGDICGYECEHGDDADVDEED
jgi:hypothetical protein